MLVIGNFSLAYGGRFNDRMRRSHRMTGELVGFDHQLAADQAQLKDNHPTVFVLCLGAASTARPGARLRAWFRPWPIHGILRQRMIRAGHARFVCTGHRLRLIHFTAPSRSRQVTRDALSRTTTPSVMHGPATLNSRAVFTL
jgi:hypothetical protein